MDLTLAIKFILALIFGALIGLERESQRNTDTKGSIGGIRTFSLISLLGGLTGFFYLNGMQAVFLVTLISLFVFIISYYIVGSLITKRTGLTTEIGAIFAFLLGLMVVIGIIPTQFIIALLVVIILVLSIKTKTKKFILGTTHRELESFITYAIIALVILPFLPNKSYCLIDIPGIKNIFEFFNIHLGILTNLEILNPYKLWFIVALITGIDVLGYILGKVFGNKESVLLASIVGGFASSTSTTQSLAQKSNKSKFVASLVGAALIANVASFFQMFLLIGPVNPKWLIYITPAILAMIVAGILVGAYYLTRKEKINKGKIEEKKKEQKIFSLNSAIKFALLLITVRIVTKLALLLFGQSGFLISSMLASFAGMDAIVINLAEVAGKTITFKSAFLVFLAVNATNLLSKTFYSYLQGKKAFTMKLMVGMAIIIVSSFMVYFIF